MRRALPFLTVLPLALFQWTITFAGGTCINGQLTGTPTPGGCCQIGQASILVASAASFSGVAGLVYNYDTTFALSLPTTVSACNPAAPLSSCTLTTDPCAD